MAAQPLAGHVVAAQPKVDQLHVPRAVDQDVLQLDVAVHHLWGEAGRAGSRSVSVLDRRGGALGSSNAERAPPWGLQSLLEHRQAALPAHTALLLQNCPTHVLAVAELQRVQQLLEDAHGLGLRQALALPHIVQQRAAAAGRAGGMGRVR